VRPGPVDRVRDRLRAEGDAETARALPRGYQRLGSVVLLRLPETLRPRFREIGRAWRAERGVTAVLRYRGPMRGEWREPSVERLTSEGGTEVEVREHGVRFRLDVARLMFARGNSTERARAGRLTRPGESVLDLFAGIGYFAIPAALVGRAAEVWAVEPNPTAFRYLVTNARLNGVEDRVRPILGDNRDVGLPEGRFDRIFLGYLPSAVPWIPRAVPLLKPSGGDLHVHLTASTRGDRAEPIAEVRDALARSVCDAAEIVARRVKPYGPGRHHMVVDVRRVRRSGSSPS
jgi:tRNA wybutosine-synthesizing protein 2